MQRIRILSNQVDEDGIFIVWGNDCEWFEDGAREILSFTCKGNVFHVRLDIPIASFGTEIGRDTYFQENLKYFPNLRFLQNAKFFPKFQNFTKI